MMHKNFMHEHKSKKGVPPTHEVLYRLQISQHQLQKDVTHQFSRFLVNRRDDETDLSDIVHIFFRGGLLSHGVLLSQMHKDFLDKLVEHSNGQLVEVLIFINQSDKTVSVLFVLLIALD